MSSTELVVTRGADDTLAMVKRELDRDPRLQSHNTRRGYETDMTAFEKWRAGRTMTKGLVEEYATYLQGKNKAPNTINRQLAAVRWWARKIGDLAFESDIEPARREEIKTQAARVAAVQDVRGNRDPKGRHIAQGELSALMTACSGDSSPAGVRDAALIALAWYTGARRSELAALTMGDYVPTIGEDGKPSTDDEWDLTIRGKGNKTRKGYAYNGAGAALADWLKVRGDAPGPIFLAIDKGGRIASHGLSTEALAQMLNKRRGQARIKPLTWHDFRRTFAGNLLNQGIDLVTIQKLMGHVSSVTTAGYDRRGAEVRRMAVQKLHVPYVRRML